MPDGIERAEPTLAPSRHRLTSELARSRFHHTQTDLKRMAYGGNRSWDSSYLLISEDVKSFLIFCQSLSSVNLWFNEREM